MRHFSKKLSALLLVAILCCGSLNIQAEEHKRITPEESFYGYVNQDYFTSFDSGIEGAYVEPVYGELICPDPQAEYEYSGDQQIQEALDEAAREVKEDLFSGKRKTEPGSPGQKILDLYDSLKHAEEDRETDDERFMEYIKPFLEAADVEEFAGAARQLYLDTGVNVLFEINVGEERETNRELPMIRFAVPKDGARVAYDPESAAVYEPQYREAMGDYMEALGYSVSEADIEEAFRLQTRSLTGKELYGEYYTARYRRAESAESNYNSLEADLDRIHQLHPDPDPVLPEGLSTGDTAVYQRLVYSGRINHTAYGLDQLKDVPEYAHLSEMLEAAGFQSDQVIIFPADLEVLKTESLTEENLNAWRINAAILVSEKLEYIPAALEDACRRMHRAAQCALWGDDTAPEEPAVPDDDESLQDKALELLPMEYALIWAEESYDQAMTGKTAEMVEKTREAYIARIRENRWLPDAERQMCIRKLENMEAIIGLPSEENYVFAEILPRSEGGSYLVNQIQFAKRELTRNLRMVNEDGYGRKAFDQELFHQGWKMDITRLNAGGNQGFNSIILPAWFLMYAVDPAADDVALLGTLGAVIAHEMSHNFDQHGAMYDENGALKNWWSEEAYEELYQIRDKFEAHFEHTEIFRGITRGFDGEMEECFADFSGITLILDLIGDDPEAQKHVLESWAGMHAFMYIASRAMLEMKVEFDMFTPHPTGAQRINGIISALDCFYDLYGVKEGDPMYTPPEERLSLW